MKHFWWDCRDNLKLFTRSSESVKRLCDQGSNSAVVTKLEGHAERRERKKENKKLDRWRDDMPLFLLARVSRILAACSSRRKPRPLLTLLRSHPSRTLSLIPPPPPPPHPHAHTYARILSWQDVNNEVVTSDWYSQGIFPVPVRNYGRIHPCSRVARPLDIFFSLIATGNPQKGDWKHTKDPEQYWRCNSGVEKGRRCP